MFIFLVVPLPAIVFIAVLLGCILILAILYQLLKRDKCCQVHGREGGDEEEQEELIPQTEGENRDAEQSQTVPNEGTEQPDGPEGLGTVVAGSSIGAALIGIGTSASGVALPVTPGSVTGSAKGGSAGGGSAAGAPAGNTSIDLSESAASFPSIELLPQEDEPVSHCGRLLLETTFSPIANKMIITVVRAADVPGVDRGGTAMVEVHLTILQDKFKKFKFRTSARPSNSPVFNERFTLYPVNLKMLEELSIRVRLYGKKAFGKKVLGEVEVLMTDIDLHSDLSDEPMWKTLLPYGMVVSLIFNLTCLVLFLF